MDRTSILAVALRETALRLKSAGTPYKWAHFGQCNCGHLAQTLTGIPAQALQRAAEVNQGDWAEQAVVWGRHRTVAPSKLDVPDYGDRPALDEGAWEPEAVELCTATATPMDEVLNQLARVGLTAEDIVHLERLSDPRIRKHLGNNTQDFHYSKREHVVQYLLAWAELIEREHVAPHPFAYAQAAE